MSEPNWPENIKAGTFICWDADVEAYYLTDQDPDIDPEATDDLFTLLWIDEVEILFDHDWQIPDEPDPLRRKWQCPKRKK